MKKTSLLITIVALFLFGCSKDGDSSFSETNIVGGNILVEYTHNIGEEYETRHTFRAQGTQFDKIYDANGNVITEFIYQGDKIVEIIATVEEGSDYYLYQYTGDAIASITLEQARNGSTTSVTDEYTYENNLISVYSSTDPPNLFKKRYTLNASGKVIEMETYERKNSGNYDWSIRWYEYDNSGRINRFQDRTGTYIVANDYHSVDDFYSGGWDFFADVKSPFRNITKDSYFPILLTPEAFNHGIFKNGSLGLIENNFVSNYAFVHDNHITEYHLIRPKNILVQTNGLPHSGNLMFGFRPFQFTYNE
jgi:hypothetical protein